MHTIVFKNTGEFVAGRKLYKLCLIFCLYFKHYFFCSVHNLFFILVNGEAYDYIGSQRLVWDMMHGNFPKEKENWAKPEENMAEFKLDDVRLIIEIGQITDRGSHTLYLHSVTTDQETKEKVKGIF